MTTAFNSGPSADEINPTQRATTIRPPERVIDFITDECELADTHQYQAWESLWADREGLYWVCGPGETDDREAGFTEASFIYDNRPRIGSRMRQLRTTRRISQVPASSLSRVVSNYRLVSDPDPDVTACWARFVLVEFRVERQRVWAGRVFYRLREVDDEYRLIEKRVVLVDRTTALDTFTFIL